MPQLSLKKRTACREAGNIKVLKSVTLLPADISPDIIAFFIMNEALESSQLMPTEAPLPLIAPNAAPTLAANSGVMSVFISPQIPLFPNI